MSAPLTVDQIKAMRSAARADPRCAGEHWFVLMARMVEEHHGVGAVADLKPREEACRGCEPVTHTVGWRCSQRCKIQP